MIFKQPTMRSKSKNKLVNLAEAKSDCAVFEKLYISCQTGDGDILEVFAHENY